MSANYIAVILVTRRLINHKIAVKKLKSINPKDHKILLVKLRDDWWTSKIPITTKDKVKATDAARKTLAFVKWVIFKNAPMTPTNRAKENVILNKSLFIITCGFN